MMSRRAIPWAVLVWTMITWGGRIRLLTDAETADTGSWARIGGSLLVGVLVWAALTFDRLPRPAAWMLAGWTIGVWGRSLIVVWSQPNTAAFRLVHTALAAVWFALAYLAVRHFAVGGGQAGSGTRSAAGSAGPGGRISESRSTTSSTDR